MVGWLPWGAIAAAAVWLAVVGLQIARYRYRTWTEAFLLATCACFVVYAAMDAYVSWTASQSNAWFAEVVGAFALTRYLRTLLFNVSPTDWVTFTVVPIILCVVALAASYFPARRATHVDPMQALRYE